MPTENGESKMLVEDEKQNMRISNQFLLGSPDSGIAPFVQFNGKYYEGFDNIKEAVEHLGKKKLQENDREAEIILISENYLLKILTKDKTTRHRKIGGKKSGGLDYLIKDNGVRAQFFQSHPQLFEWRWQEIVLNNDKKIKFEMGFEFWNEFFAIERGIENQEIDEKEILNFMEKHLVIILGSDVSSDGVGSSNYSYSDGTEGSSHSLNREINNDYLWNLDDWQYFYEWMDKFVKAKLEEYFTKEKNSMEGKLREYLQNHSWDQVSDEKIYESFEKIIQKIVNMLGSQKFLFGDQQSLADISLFSILVQFFEGHLNIPVIKHFFLKKGEKPEREDIKSIGKAIVIEQKSKSNCEIEEEGPSFIENCGEIEGNDKYIDKRIGHLHSYVERMKEKIGLGSFKWINLTRYPWPLNYEEIDYMTDSGKLSNKIFWPDKNDEDRKMYGKIILHSIAAAYCNLGKGKTLEDANKCQKMHKNKALELKQYVVDDAGKSAFNEKGSYFSSAPSVNTTEIKANIDFHVRNCLKIAYETIQKYNENGIIKNVEEAINKAWIIKKNEERDSDNKQDNQEI
uniref:GST C-terminal domain-containing protein n=1 Tax=Meloidogyne floridensis TaxID=298350 RepID=A0A915P887_9BILA